MRPRRGGISGCGAVAPGHLGFGRPGFGAQGMDSAVGVEGNSFIMELYEIVCVKLLKILKHYRI